MLIALKDGDRGRHTAGRAWSSMALPWDELPSM
jgi:hypothetical protein